MQQFTEMSIIRYKDLLLLPMFKDFTLIQIKNKFSQIKQKYGLGRGQYLFVRHLVLYFNIFTLEEILRELNNLKK